LKETVIVVLQNQTSIKLKAATLEKIESEYSFVVEVARKNIPRISQSINGAVLDDYLSKWEDALSDKSMLMTLVADNSDYGFDMWQINPFTGIFSPKERWNILRGKHE